MSTAGVLRMSLVERLKATPSSATRLPAQAKPASFSARSMKPNSWRRLAR
jgi:hypothetical protein